MTSTVAVTRLMHFVNPQARNYEATTNFDPAILLPQFYCLNLQTFVTHVEPMVSQSFEGFISLKSGVQGFVTISKQ